MAAAQCRKICPEGLNWPGRIVGYRGRDVEEEANEASRVLYYDIDKKYYTHWQNPEDFLILTGMPCQITFPLQCKRLGFQMTGRENRGE